MFFNNSLSLWFVGVVLRGDDDESLFSSDAGVLCKADLRIF